MLQVSLFNALVTLDTHKLIQFPKKVDTGNVNLFVSSTPKNENSHWIRICEILPWDKKSYLTHAK